VQHDYTVRDRAWCEGMTPASMRTPGRARRLARSRPALAHAPARPSRSDHRNRGIRLEARHRPANCLDQGKIDAIERRAAHESDCPHKRPQSPPLFVKGQRPRLNPHLDLINHRADLGKGFRPALRLNHHPHPGASLCDYADPPPQAGEGFCGQCTLRNHPTAMARAGERLRSLPPIIPPPLAGEGRRSRKATRRSGGKRGSESLISSRRAVSNFPRTSFRKEPDDDL